MLHDDPGDETYRTLVAKKNKEVYPSENNPTSKNKPFHQAEIGSLLELLLDAAKVSETQVFFRHSMLRRIRRAIGFAGAHCHVHARWRLFESHDEDTLIPRFHEQRLQRLPAASCLTHRPLCCCAFFLRYHERMRMAVERTGLPDDKLRYKQGPIKKPARIMCKFIMRMTMEDLSAVIGSFDSHAAARALDAVGKLLKGAKDAIRGMVTADDGDSAAALHEAFTELHEEAAAIVVSFAFVAGRDHAALLPFPLPRH